MDHVAPYCSIETLLASYRSPAIRKWIYGCYFNGGAHGSKLAEKMGTPHNGKPGMTDNCRASDKILNALVQEEWILRSETATPSREQRFFGWGGRRPTHKNLITTVYASEFYYQPNIGSLALRRYLGVA